MPTTETNPDWSNCYVFYGGGQNMWVLDSTCEQTSNAAVKISRDFGGDFGDSSTINIQNVDAQDGKPVCFFDGGRDVLLQNQVFGCEWADAGTIVNAYSGKCLDLPNGNAFNGANIHTWDCNGAPNQQWVWADDTMEIHYAPDPSKCVEAGDVNWMDVGYGNQLFLWDCNGGDQQKILYDVDNQKTMYFWATYDQDLGHHTLCVEVPQGGLDAGAPVWTWECNGYGNQRWEVGNMPTLEASV